jgi:hypothetical protein
MDSIGEIKRANHRMVRKTKGAANCGQIYVGAGQFFIKSALK